MGKHASDQRSAAMVGEVCGWVADGQAVAARTKAGLSQADLARQLRVSQASIATWERGNSVPTGERLSRYHRFIKRFLFPASTTK